MSADESYLIEAAICKSQAAQEQQELTAVATLGLTPYKDGNQWCVMWGNAPAISISGFGDTPIAAI